MRKKKRHRSQRADEMIMVKQVTVMVWDVVWEIMTKGGPPF
jgi:hypothetical protein